MESSALQVESAGSAESWLQRDLAALEQFNFRKIGEGIAQNVPLSLDSALQLIQAPLAVLGKLINIQSQALRRRSPFRIRPVLLFPAAALIEADQLGSGVEVLSNLLLSECAQLPRAAPIYLALDRWHGEFYQLDLFLLIQQTLRTLRPLRDLRIVGPSTAELLEIELRQYRTRHDRENLSRILQDLSSCDMRVIDGGTSLDTHSIGAQHHFALAYGHDVTYLFEHSIQTGKEALQQLHPLLFERFLAELLDVRDRLAATGTLKVWFPWSRIGSENRYRGVKQPFGASILNIIALARLVLPDVPFIRAPLTLLGAHLTDLSQNFGATDAGYAAIDERTSNALGITLLSSVTGSSLGRGELR